VPIASSEREFRFLTTIRVRTADVCGARVSNWLFLQLRWMRRSKFSVGRNFYGWAVENGTVYTAGGRVDSRSLECAADIRCVSAERVVRGCQSPCDAVNAAMQGRQDDAMASTPWRLVGQLPAPMCIFAHCVVTLPVAAATSAAATAAATAGACNAATHSTSPDTHRS
jgi:hypothetical protein